MARIWRSVVVLSSFLVCVSSIDEKQAAFLKAYDEGMQSIFKKYDKDGSGGLDKEEACVLRQWPPR